MHVRGSKVQLKTNALSYARTHACMYADTYLFDNLLELVLTWVEAEMPQRCTNIPGNEIERGGYKNDAAGTHEMSAATHIYTMKSVKQCLCHFPPIILPSSPLFTRPASHAPLGQCVKILVKANIPPMNVHTITVPLITRLRPAFLDKSKRLNNALPDR